jgi:hypothetical protein
VFTFDVFFSAETTMHCKVTCILYKELQSVPLFAGLFQELECLFVMLKIYFIYKVAEKKSNSFLPRTIKDWNALPTHLVHVTSVDEFGSVKVCF